MGLFETKWEAEYEGHTIRVARSEVTRGFEVRIDGEKVGGKLFTLIGVGEALGHYNFHGKDCPVKVELSVASECNVWVDGKWVKMMQL